jgi:putative hydrolase of the HAD superfamily
LVPWRFSQVFANRQKAGSESQRGHFRSFPILMTIKVILFDFGGTYAEGSVSTFIQKGCAILGISKARFEANHVLFDREYNKGKITIQEFFKRYFGVPISEERMQKLIAAWKSTWKPEPGMVSLVHQLRKNYRVGILSNSDPVNFKMGTEKGWYQPFDFLVMSHELGVAKPGKEIYFNAIQESGCRPEEILFIDDQQACLETAEKLGMKTILFQSTEQLKKELKRLEIEY